MTTAVIRSSQKIRENIREFLLAAESLPSPEGAAARLQDLADSPVSSIDDFVKVIKADPSLSGFVLRTANSALYGGGGRLMNIQQAVMRMGINIVRIHAMALSLAKLQKPLACEGFDYGEFWTQALLSAELMSALAAQDDRLPGDEAFALGLLGGIGRLVFATAAPQRYADVLQRFQQGRYFLDDLERAEFGFDHHELSAVTFMNWNLSTAMAEMVFWQRAPEDGGFPATSRAYHVCGALQLANQLAAACLCRQRLDADTLSAVYLRGALLGLTPADMRALARRGLAALPEWQQMLGVSFMPLQVLPEGWPT